jgi:hypothetical protein
MLSLLMMCNLASVTIKNEPSLDKAIPPGTLMFDPSGSVLPLARRLDTPLAVEKYPAKHTQFDSEVLPLVPVVTVSAWHRMHAVCPSAL